MNPGVAAVEGFALGALAGAVGGAVAGAVGRGRDRRANEDMRTQLHLQRQRDEQSFEERLQRLEAARAPARAEPAAASKRADTVPTKSDPLELSPRAREFSAE